MKRKNCRYFIVLISNSNINYANTPLENNDFENAGFIKSKYQFKKKK